MGASLTISGSASGGTVDFGVKTDVLFTLTNTGDATLTLGTIQVTGAGFSIIALPEDTIAPGGSDLVSVRRTSTAATGLLTIASDDAASPYTLTLKASGRGPLRRRGRLLRRIL